MSLIYLALLSLLYGFTSLPSHLSGKISENTVVKDEVSVTMSSPIRKRKRTSKDIKKVKFNPFKKSTSIIFNSLSLVKGETVGNIRTSGEPEVIRVNTNDPRFSQGSYFVCRMSILAKRYNYRFFGTCKKLVTSSGEYKIYAGLKDEFHTNGIEADETYISDEEDLLVAGAAGVIGNSINRKKDVIDTAAGLEDVISLKNSAYSGILNTLGNVVNDKLDKNKSSILMTLNSNKKVLVEFKERFEYEY